MKKVTRIYVHKSQERTNPRVEFIREDSKGHVTNRRYLIKNKKRSDRVDFKLLRLVDFTGLFTWPDSMSATFNRRS